MQQTLELEDTSGSNGLFQPTRHTPTIETTTTTTTTTTRLSWCFHQPLRAKRPVNQAPKNVSPDGAWHPLFTCDVLRTAATLTTRAQREDQGRERPQTLPRSPTPRGLVAACPPSVRLQSARSATAAVVRRRRTRGRRSRRSGSACPQAPPGGPLPVPGNP